MSNWSTEGIIRLYKAVILQAIRDAHLTIPKARNQGICPDRYRLIRDQAREFILGNGETFRTICVFAELDPDYVLRKCKDLQKAGWKELKLKRG